MALMNDGFNTTITFAGAGVVFVEKEVTPPAMDGGGEINITAMRNNFWRTKSPKYLVTLDKMSLKVRYDGIVYAAGSVRSTINTNRLITLNFPTLFSPNTGQGPARTVSFWGWLNKFAPESMKEGEEPLADAEIIPSLINSSGVETSPTTT